MPSPFSAYSPSTFLSSYFPAQKWPSRTWAKYKADGTALLWSTYLGGTGTDDARAIDSDASGNVYITGLTGSRDFPTANAQQATPSVNGASESFVTRIGETPVISPNGLLGGATFGAGFTPGAILSLFGTYLGASTGSAAAVPLPTKISGATVKVNGVAAPLYYVSPTQINFQLPYEGVGSSAQVTVTLANLTSAPATISIAAAAPGIFITTSSGKGQGVVLIYPNNEIAGPTGSIPGAAVRPIKKGEFAIIYASGLGAVNNGPKSGEPSPANPATTVLPVTVTIRRRRSSGGLRRAGAGIRRAVSGERANTGRRAGGRGSKLEPLGGWNAVEHGHHRDSVRLDLPRI